MRSILDSIAVRLDEEETLEDDVLQEALSAAWVEAMIAWDVGARWAWTVLRASVPLATAQVAVGTQWGTLAYPGAGRIPKW